MKSSLTWGVHEHPFFFSGGTVTTLWLIMLGTGVICALIIILIAAINEYLRGHDG